MYAPLPLTLAAERRPARRMAGSRKIDADVRTSLNEGMESKTQQCAVKRLIIPFTVLIFLILIAVIAGLAAAVITKGKCQTEDPKILPVFRDPCEDGWIWYMKKCYYFSTNISEWEKSQDFCASRNASLATIDWRHELDFILRFKGSSDHWIGLRRANDIRPWVWTDGSNFNDMFPIVGFSNCVLVNSGRISSASCYSDKHWICNKPDARTTNHLF